MTFYSTQSENTQTNLSKRKLVDAFDKSNDDSNDKLKKRVRFTKFNKPNKNINNKRRPRTSFFEGDLDTVTNNRYDDKIIMLINDKPANEHIIFDDDEFDDPFLSDLFTDLETPPKNNNPPKNSNRSKSTDPVPIDSNPPKPSNPEPQNPFILFFPMFDDPSTSRNKRLINSKKPDKVQPKPVVPTKLICHNPLCNHKTFEEDPTLPTEITLKNINSIDDLITLGKAFHCKKQTTYNSMNLRIMNELIVPLTELNDMIGMNDVKGIVVDQILFFLQGFNTIEKCNNCQDCIFGLPCVQTNTEMMHSIITGAPGVGKTCLGRIMGKVYKAMGILSNGEFHEVTRKDFIAEYLGQSAIKTQNLVDKCKGGVMFIDEAYSMGSKEKRDSFAKEAIDTLNKNLSDNRDLLCIVAGYEKDLEECFFSINAGLKRRFSFKYDVKAYDYKELLKIFKLKIAKENWSIEYNNEESDGKIYNDDYLLDLFKSHQDKFPYSGGDIETYFLQCKIAHSRRLPLKKKCFSFSDLRDGFNIFTKNRKHKKVPNADYEIRPNMYGF